MCPRGDNLEKCGLMDMETGGERREARDGRRETCAGNIYSRPGLGNVFYHRGFCAENRVPVATRSVAENRGE